MVKKQNKKRTKQERKKQTNIRILKALNNIYKILKIFDLEKGIELKKYVLVCIKQNNNIAHIVCRLSWYKILFNTAHCDKDQFQMIGSSW